MALLLVANEEEHDELMDLPPGFRFHPTDEEIITHYLTERVLNNSFTARAIGEVDFNKCEPWDLPKRAKMGEKEWYFFCHKDRKYPTGMRTNRATESGYWKATGKDKEIRRGGNSASSSTVIIGMKKTLVFYLGRAPKGNKTNWVMHEYRLQPHLISHLPSKEYEWAVCRVFHKSPAAAGTMMKRPPPPTNSSVSLGRMDSFKLDDLLFISSSSPPPTAPAPTLTDPEGGVTGAPVAEHQYYFSQQQKQESPQFFLPQNPPLNPPFASKATPYHPQSADGAFFRSHAGNYGNYPFPGFPASGAQTGKAEQLSSTRTPSVATVSQETGVSYADVNAEISSGVDSSKQDEDDDVFRYGLGLEDPSISGVVPDNLGFLWNYSQ